MNEALEMYKIKNPIDQEFNDLEELKSEEKAYMLRSYFDEFDHGFRDKQTKIENAVGKNLIECSANGQNGIKHFFLPGIRANSGSGIMEFYDVDKKNSLNGISSYASYKKTDQRIFFPYVYQGAMWDVEAQSNRLL